ncbi:MAG: putative toxin-antitoxin system toxin component, PIN family [Bacteroides intestinalis]
MSRRDVVLDTNCLVQMLSAASPYYAAWRAFIEKRYTLCVSNEILSEYQEVIECVTGSPAVAENVMLLLINSRNLRKLDPHFHFGLIERDPDDNKFVDCAIIAGADYIVSNDAHFRHLAAIPFPHVDVICLDRFLRELEEEAGGKEE